MEYQKVRKRKKVYVIDFEKNIVNIHQGQFSPKNPIVFDFCSELQIFSAMTNNQLFENISRYDDVDVNTFVCYDSILISSEAATLDRIESTFGKRLKIKLKARL